MPLSLKNLLLTDVQQNPGRKSNGLYLKLMIVSPSQFDMVLLLLSGTVVDQELVSELYILFSSYLPFFHKGHCENFRRQLSWTQNSLLPK